MTDGRTMDVDTFVDGLKFNSFHVRVLAISTIMMMIDGYDLALVGWVLPDLASSFGVAATDLTSALVAQQVGMVIGAYLIAPLADRFGRRPVLLAAIAGISLSCFATIFMTTIWGFAACRLVTGAFASTIIAILVALAGDVAPSRLRGRMATIVLTGSMGGAMLGALMQAFILEDYGWEGAMWIGAIMPLVMLPLVYLLLPESLRFLVTRRPGDPRIQTLAAAMQGGVAQPIWITEPVATAARADVRAFVGHITQPGNRLPTVLLWSMFVCSFIFISIYSGWSTTLFKEMDALNWQQIAMTTAVYTAFGAIGTLSAGVAIDRFGFQKVLPVLLLGAGLAVAVIGMTGTPQLLFAAIAVMAAFQVGGHSGLSTLAASVYDARHRASGVGWAYGAGRIASIFGPLLGAQLVHSGLDKHLVFALIGAPLIVASVLSLILLSRAGSSQPAPA